jgi:hypothetical protein
MSVPDGPDPAGLVVDARDPRACLAFIAGLPLTNARATHQALADLLAKLASDLPSAASYLEVLEAARAPLAFVQSELAQRYAAKPLPPAASEEEAFHQVLALWRAMSRAYAQAAQLGGDDSAARSYLPLICQRCVHYAGRAILEHFRARREPAQGVWIDLHGYYATAEEWGIADVRVAEPLGGAEKKQSSADAYAEILLVDLASPYGRSPRELGWILGWAGHFAPLTAILPAAADDSVRAFGVDLMEDRSTRPLEILPRRESVRRFDTARLMQEVQRVLAGLKQHIHPAALGLGEDCPGASAGRLLLQLYRPWCLHATPRRFQRRQASGLAEVCYGFEAIHYRVSGSEFNQPEHVRMYSRSDMERIWTFRDQVDPTQHLRISSAQAQLGYPLEKWEVADQSVSGFRLQRGSAGARIEHGQLFCLKPPDGEHFLLAQVSWYLLQEATGGLLAGVQTMPGIPQGIAIRAAGFPVSPSERYLRAFLLPAVPALKEDSSLVIPRGWFQAERVIELYTDRQAQVRLSGLLGQGSDFERVTFTRL